MGSSWTEAASPDLIGCLLQPARANPAGHFCIAKQAASGPPHQTRDHATKLFLNSS